MWNEGQKASAPEEGRAEAERAKGRVGERQRRHKAKGRQGRGTFQLAQVELLVSVLKIAYLEVVQARIQCSQPFSSYLSTSKDWG